MYEYSGLWVLVSVALIGFGIFVFALLIRLWDTLGHIRHSCQLFNLDSDAMKIQAIEMCENRESVYVIARKFKTSPKEAKKYV